MRAIWTVTFVLFAIFTAQATDAGRKGLKLTINKKDVDLTNRTLYFRLNRAVDSAEIKVYSTDGNLLAERTKLYDGARAHTRLSISWPQLLGEDAENFRIELKVTDVDEWLAFGKAKVRGGAVCCGVPANDVRVLRLRTRQPFLNLRFRDVPWHELGVGVPEWPETA